MPFVSRHPLPVVHAVMDEVDALQASQGQREPADLINQVEHTYRDLGIPVDRDLIEQAVAARAAPKEASVPVLMPDPSAALFDFGWDRPATASLWARACARRRQLRNGMAAFLKGASSVAFFVWCWMVFVSVPPALDHPWLFAFACMGLGSAMKHEIARRKQRDQQWEAAKIKGRRRMAKWQASDQVQRYLKAMQEQGDVPLLWGDVNRLDSMAEHDAQMAKVQAQANGDRWAS